MKQRSLKRNSGTQFKMYVALISSALFALLFAFNNCSSSSPEITSYKDSSELEVGLRQIYLKKNAAFNAKISGGSPPYKIKFHGLGSFDQGTMTYYSPESTTTDLLFVEDADGRLMEKRFLVDDSGALIRNFGQFQSAYGLSGAKVPLDTRRYRALDPFFPNAKGYLVNDLDFQSDGSIIAHVSAVESSSDLIPISESLDMAHFLVKFDGAGKLVSTFGPSGEGYLFTSLESRFNGVAQAQHLMKVLPDNRILTVGTMGSQNASHTLGLRRYLPDGRTDPSFGGSNGLVSYQFRDLASDRPANYDNVFDRDLKVFDIEVDAVSRLVVTGAILKHYRLTPNPSCAAIGCDPTLNPHPENRWMFFVARFNEDGSLDSSFNSTGFLSIDFSPQIDLVDNDPVATNYASWARDILILKDGRMILSGGVPDPLPNAVNSDNPIFGARDSSHNLMACLNEDGSFCQNFGPNLNGIWVMDLSQYQSQLKNPNPPTDLSGNPISAEPQIKANGGIIKALELDNGDLLFLAATTELYEVGGASLPITHTKPYIFTLKSVEGKFNPALSGVQFDFLLSEEQQPKSFHEIYSYLVAFFSTDEQHKSKVTLYPKTPPLIPQNMVRLGNKILITGGLQREFAFLAQLRLNPTTGRLSFDAEFSQKNTAPAFSDLPKGMISLSFNGSQGLDGNLADKEAFCFPANQEKKPLYTVFQARGILASALAQHPDGRILVGTSINAYLCPASSGLSAIEAPDFNILAFHP